jgi:hypothetical protein
MKKSDQDDLEKTKSLMGTLVRMKPMPHEKVGKTTVKEAKSPAKKRVSSKPKAG